MNRLVVVLLLWLLSGSGASAAAGEVAWAGRGKYRLLVEVRPTPAGMRDEDELPAEVEIDWVAQLKKLGVDGTPDLNSLQVVRYDAATGRPQVYGGYAYAVSDFDRPFRWYDGAIPYEFPEFGEAVSRTGGEIWRRGRVRGGYFFNAVGQWREGRLAWLHTQRGRQAAAYAIYFDLLPNDGTPTAAPPRSWLGDGLPRCDRQGRSSMGADHCRLEVDDWNDDGLADLIVGENYGHVLWWQNRGTRQSPRFPSCQFVTDADGLPLDAGMIAAPKVVDWDGDGAKDLLVGAEWNRILYYRNRGTDADRQLEYQGLLEIDGQPLQLPTTPLTRGSEEVFRRDYYPVLETADWDGDGELDLLAGGYITGRVYFYRSTGRRGDGTPQLELQGPIAADGGPLNVRHWCAAPCAADFDGDGDLDLVAGRMPMYERDRQRRGGPLMYFENQSEGTPPRLRARSFPAAGPPPATYLATPRAFDFDGDGDLDLAVSAREQLYLWMNQGSRQDPRFDLQSEPLPSRWGLATLAVDQLRDWNGDGQLDLIHNYHVRLNTGAGNPYRWGEPQPILPPGQRIEHPSGIGDDWFFPLLDDFDQDGKQDVLFGDWHGHVWLHRNRSQQGRSEFDLQGVKLQLESGELIKVGPAADADPDKAFDALQGARTVFTAADFDRDGRRDLVVGDTYGKVRYYRNTGGAPPRFAAPADVGDLGIRLLVDATDWNGDGWMDVIAGAANGRVRVFLNTAGRSPRFAAGVDPALPPIMQPRVLTGDINGDGDEDLFLPSTQGSCFVERSFLRHGYAQARIVAIERQ